MTIKARSRIASTDAGAGPCRDQDPGTPPRPGDRAASPIIGVTLLIAIVVVLAAIITPFLTDLAGDLSKSAQAGASVEFEKAGGGDGEVLVTYVDRGNSEKLEIDYEVETNPGSNDLTFVGSAVLDEPGDTTTLTEAAGNVDEDVEVKITVVAFLDSGEKAVVLEKTGTI